MAFKDFFVNRSVIEPTVMASPWAEESHLAPAFAYAEALGLSLSALPMDRAQAIQLPAVARSRGLIVGSIAPLPLVALNASGQVSNQPTFLYRSNTEQNPHLRMSLTVDDLLFYGTSLWVVQRGAKTAGLAFGPILDAYRLERGLWQIRNRRIEIRTTESGVFQPVDSEDVILFTGPTGGLLTDTRDTLLASQAVERAYVSRAQNPLPITVIQHTAGSDGDMDDDEIDDVVDGWKAARQSPDGAVGYLPRGLEISTPGSDASTTHLQDARNAVRIDIANHVNLPVALLDGGVSETSLTYKNAQGEVSRFYGDLNFWMDPIAHRLSQDDVVPRGQRVRFDLSGFMTPAPPATGVPTED